MATTQTVAEVPSAVNNFYVRTMLKAARPLLVHTRWAQVKDIPRNSSEAIRFRRYTLLSAATTALTEGTTPSGSTLTVTNVTSTVLQYGDFIQLSDYLQFTTLDPLITELSDMLGQQAGNTLDQLCRNVINAGTTVQYASSATSRATVTAAMTISRDEVREAVRTLQNNNAEKLTSMVNPDTGFNTSPLNACYVAISSPSTLYDLKNATGFIPVEQYANKSNVMDGEAGAMDDVRFVVTTNASTFASTVTVHATLVLAKNYYAISRVSGEAMKMITKPLGSAGSADPLDQRSTIGWKASFITTRLNENFCVRIEHGVTA